MSLRICKLEGDADDRLAVGACPLVRQVAGGAEPLQAPRLQLPVKLLDVLLHGRAVELEPQVADRFTEQFFRLGWRVLERLHAPPREFCAPLPCSASQPTNPQGAREIG